MKTLFLVALLSMNSAWALSLGDSMPAGTTQSTEMKNVDGKMLTLKALSEAKGSKGTLVIFMCNHCPFVKAWLDRIVELGNEYQKKGFSIVAINSNDPKETPEDDFESMQKLAKGKMNFPYLVDATSEVAKSYGASKTPEFYLFDATRKLVYQGAIDGDSRNPKTAQTWLKAALNEVLAGKKVTTAETKALGCMIKFRTAKN